MEKISIIIPAYNEEKRIKATLETYGNFFNKLKKDKKLDYEILVVINNTHDKTEEVIKDCQKRNKNIRYLNFDQGGKGFAIIEGFKDALKRKENSLLGFVDADMATLPEAFYALIRNINGFDGLIASRYMKKSIVNPRQSIQRVIVSRIYNFFMRALLNLHYSDTQCGAKIFKRKTVESILPELTLSKWAFDVDLLYSSKRLGFKIIEYPTVWADKEYSKINLMNAGPWMTMGIIRLRILNSPFKCLIRIYDKILNKIWKWT